MAYTLSKPFKTGLTYMGKGTYKFVMQEVVATDYDNHELGVSEYYRYFDKDGNVLVKEDTPAEPSGGKKVWL